MPARSPLEQPAQFLKGVGPKRAEALARLGIRTARDLLYHIPHRYEDASTVTRIINAEVGHDVTVIGEVVSKGVLPTRSGLRIFQAVLRDVSGMIECSWPGQPFLDRSIGKGDLVLATGPVRFYHGRQLQPREHVVLGKAAESAVAGKVLPIYAATEGLSQKMIRHIVDENLDRLLPLLPAEDVFAADARARTLPSLMKAVAAVHRPDSIRAAEAGRVRLAYEEAFFLQLLHARAKRRATVETPGIAFGRTDTLIAAMYRRLPFELTDAQTRAIAEILADMTATRRMNRLLQGDVGSGKTVVALFAMLLAAEAGWQSALMAPTEILAEQHARTIGDWLDPLGVRSVLLTGRLPAPERRAAEQAIASGEARIVIGTHALIHEGAAFKRLGLAVVDEQHRFGVRQRLALAERAAVAGCGGVAGEQAAAAGDRAGGADEWSGTADRRMPDVLVMSATPIPRSLALTLYGDLDLSVLDELPAERRPIRTALRNEKSRDAVYAFVREQVAAGRQAYIVYPLVEESEKLELRAASAEYDRLAGEVFADLRVGLLHGQMPSDEKDETMRRFARGEIDVLVATSIVEVGIDVANATVMVVEHADRFGLSQLHQLRGRVGRGGEASYCILIAPGSPAARERLRILATTQDGFEIARADLRIRGMGDFFGAKQHGLPDFRFLDPQRDESIMVSARDHALAVVEDDPELSQPGHAPVRAALELRLAVKERMYEVG